MPLLGCIPCASSFAMVVGAWEEPTDAGGRVEPAANPPAASVLATGGGVVSVRCVYRHLPLIYQFSNGCVFDVGAYAWNCCVFVDQRGLFAAI